VSHSRSLVGNLVILFTGGCIVLLVSVVDAEICKTARTYDMNLARHFELVLQGNVKPSKSTKKFQPQSQPWSLLSDFSVLH
jgi:hypothetical protein